MQDASYAQTVGVSVTGRMTYNDAMTFANGVLYYDSERDFYWDDWRLPNTVSERSSIGYDLTGQSSELGFMYYINLGYAPNYAPNPADPAPSSTNHNPFTNLLYLGFWSQTIGFREEHAWQFLFHFGFADTTDITDSSLAWLVRDGDVGAFNVPEPGTFLLLGTSILGLFVVRRKRPDRGNSSASEASSISSGS
jgi:hypothetical protein